MTRQHLGDLTAGRKARRSSDSGGNCVHWSQPTNEGVRVWDSKDPDGPRIHVSPDEWTDLLRAVASAAPHSMVVNLTDGGAQLCKDGTVLTFTEGEWVAFADYCVTGDDMLVMA